MQCTDACSVTQLCLTFCYPMDLICQAPQSMEFSRQEYWCRLPFPTPGDLLDPGIEHTSPESPALAGRFFSTEPPGKPMLCIHEQLYVCLYL